MAPHVLDLAAFWPRLLAGIAAAALTWIVAADYGVALVSRWADFARSAERLGVGAATGYALLGSAVAVLGLFGGIRPLALWLLLLVAIVVRLPVHRRRFRELPRFFQSVLARWRDLKVADRAACCVIVAAIVTGIVAAALPAVWWDPIAYHLPLVASALAHGTFIFSPQMVQTGFPQLGEAAALPAYAIAGSAGAAMATLGAGLCLALLTYAVSSRIAPGSGIVAAMLVTSCELWLWLAPTFYVDVPFAMFAVASILTILASQHRATPNKGSVANLFATFVLVGLLCGAAAAVKYSGLGVCAIVFIFVAVRTAPRWEAIGGFLLGVVLIAAGWYVRTFAVTGDPVYPFLSVLTQYAAVRDFGARYVDMTRHWCGGGTSLTDLVLLPDRLIVAPRTFCGDPGLALRAGIVFAAVGLIATRSTLVVGLVTLALTVAWFFLSQQWRFALAPLSLYAALVAVGTSAVGARLRSVSVVAVTVLCAYSVLVNWLPSTRLEAAQSIVPSMRYIVGKESAAQYLDARLETFAAAQWLAQHGIAGEQILALDDVRDYYFPVGTRWGNPYYQQALVVDWQASPRARYDVLRALGIRYLVVNANDAYTHRTPTGIDWTVLAADERTALRADFRANGVTVYDLGGRSARSPE